MGRKAENQFSFDIEDKDRQGIPIHTKAYQQFGRDAAR